MSRRYPLIGFLFAFFAFSVSGQTTTFTYQGFIKQDNAPANGNFYFEFALFDQPVFGTQIGTTITLDPVAVNMGSFTVELDFGNQFTGANRYLEIHVRRSGIGGLQILSPRKLITNAPNALNATSLGGLPAASYIQNTVTQQSNANLNIGGNAVVGGNIGVGTNTPSANLNIVGTQPLDNNGSQGTNATDALTVVGGRGGRGGDGSQGGNGANISFRAGDGGTSPQGSNAEGLGGSITLQPGLSGNPAKQGKIVLAPDGGNVGVGMTNPTFKLDVNGSLRSRSAQIIGAPVPSLPGNPVGTNAGMVFEVVAANGGDTSGSTMGNPHIGGNGGNVSIKAGDAGQNLDNQTSDGSGGSITLQPGLSRDATKPGVVSIAPIGGKVTVGTSTPTTASLTVVNPAAGITDPSIANLPPVAVRGEATATTNTTIGVLGLANSVGGVGVIGITNGTGDPGKGGDAIGVLATSTSSTGQTIGLSTEVSSPDGTALDIHMPTGGNGFLIYASSGAGGGFQRKEGNSSTKFSVNAAGQVDIYGGLMLDGNFTSGTLSINSSNLTTSGNVQANNVTTTGDVSVGNNLTTTGSTLNINKNVSISGTITPGLLSGGDNHLCNLTGTSTLRFCSSSLRYKTNVQPYARGLDLIRQLNPISFDWKENGLHDIGLGAEDVRKIEPTLTFNNPNGEVEGVKYTQLSAVFINAFKQQQAQIEAQNKLIAAQARLLNRFAVELRSLKRRVNGQRHR